MTLIMMDISMIFFLDPCAYMHVSTIHITEPKPTKSNQIQPNQTNQPNQLNLPNQIENVKVLKYDTV